MGLTTIPFIVTGMWGKYIDILFGGYTGYLSFFLLQGLLHRAHSRVYNKNRTSQNASKLILSMKLIDKTTLEIEYYEIFRKGVNSKYLKFICFLFINF